MEVQHGGMLTRARWPVAGRDTEADHGLHLLRTGSRGLLIHGDAGVGKTTLAKGILTELNAAPDAPQVVRLRTDAAMLSTPWTVYADVLDGTEQESASLNHALQALRRRLSTTTPTLVHLEDAHLLDTPSATVLAELLQSTTIMVLATTRQVPGPPAPLVALWREGVLDRLDLQPLDLPTVVGILRQFLAGPVTQETTHRMWQATGGNPLYLRELALALTDSGALHLTEGAWSWDGRGPTSRRLTDLVLHELSGLRDEAREMIDLVALAGTIPLDQIGELVSDDAVETVIRSGLLVMDSDDRTGREYARITHPLHAESIRSLIRPRRRRALFHRLPAPTVTTTGLNELFHRVNWALQCGIEPDPDHLLMATRAAAEVQGTTLTIQMATEALRRFDHDPAVATEILVLRAEAHRFDATVHRAWQDLDAARALLSRVPPVRANIWLSVRIAELTADLQQYHGDDLDSALITLTRAQQELPVRCAAAEHRLLIGRLTRLGFAGQFATCVPEIEQVRAAAAASHPASVQLVPVLALGYAQQGRLDEALELCTQALTSWREEYNAFPWVHGEIRSAWFMACLWRGDVEASITPPGAGRLDLGRYDEAVSQTGAGRFHAALGQWHRAIAEYRGALSRFAVRDPSGMAPMAWVGLAQACAAIGAVDEARAARARYLDLATRATRVIEADCRRALVQVAMALGEPDAYQQARHLVGWSTERGLHLSALHAQHLALCTAAPAGRPDLLADLIRFADQVDGPVPRAVVHHAQALITGDTQVAAFHVKELAEYGLWVPIIAPQVSLTPRQREIANLVIQGLSNREIATRLVVSVRTVDTHVGHIFDRLSVHSRSDLARALARVDQA